MFRYQATSINNNDHLATRAYKLNNNLPSHKCGDWNVSVPVCGRFGVNLVRLVKFPFCSAFQPFLFLVFLFLLILARQYDTLLTCDVTY